MLYDHSGHRKYLTALERAAFFDAARRCGPVVETFCCTLAYSGARISEVLAITPARVDISACVITVECLKRRSTGIFRAIPVPDNHLARLEHVHGIASAQINPWECERRLWPWSRTTAWMRIKEVMVKANIGGGCAMPKGLRHAFGVHGTVESGVPLNIMQKWMGHARIETTAIYANAVGKEERMLAARMWK